MTHYLQAWLITTTAMGVLLLDDRFTRRMTRWGYLAMLMAQPAWIWSVAVAKPFPWGIAVLVAIYTYYWSRKAWLAWASK